jgi:polyferredoxin
MLESDIITVKVVFDLVKNLIRWLFFGLFLFLVLNGKMFLWLAIFGLSMVLSLFWGRIYCGYICPMNTVMIPAEKLSVKLGLQAKKVPKILKTNWLPWVVLFLMVAVTAFFKKTMSKDLPMLMALLILSVVVTLRYKQYVFHNHVCPFGVLQKWSGKNAKRSHRVDAASCIGCKICEKTCPTGAVLVEQDTGKAVIDIAYCLQCGNCTEVCPKKAIEPWA